MDEEEWDDELDDYIEHVTTEGYALTLLDRFMCFLRACGFAICAIFTGLFGWFMASITKDASSSAGAFWSFGWLTLVFTICFFAVTLAIAVAALTQLAAALVGKERFGSRVLRDHLGS